MPDFGPAFTALKAILAQQADHLVVRVDKPGEYVLHTKVPSPFPQHKGQTLYFGMVKTGKAYASFHLMPLYMCDPLSSLISPALKKRMQGKTCFNFKTVPGPEILDELTTLTEAGLKAWTERNWA